MEHVPVFGSTTGSVRSTSPNVQTTLAQPVLGVQQSQTTAFVQPTQQQSVPPAEPASQEPASANVMMEATPSTSQMERPSTSTAVFGTGDLSHELNLICVERALTGAASLSCSNTRCVRGCVDYIRFMLPLPLLEFSTYSNTAFPLQSRPHLAVPRPSVLERRSSRTLQWSWSLRRSPLSLPSPRSSACREWR